MAPTPLLRIGDPAPLFTLPDQKEKPTSLKDLLATHAVVLVFYPGDLTPGCSMQLSALRDDAPKFKAAGALVLGVNHGDAKSHASFQEKCRLPFPLLTDAKKLVATKYGAIRKLGQLTLIRRTVVVITRDGKIRFMRKGMPKNSEILKALKA